MGTPDARVDWVVVGGGIHGVHLAVRLLESGLASLDRLRIVEPDALFGAFRAKCTSCGMTEFRSPFVHHVDSDPFSLRDYARANGRTNEFVPSEFGADRPSASLFFDHAEQVCDQYGLESAHLKTRVTRLRDDGRTVHLETIDGQIQADWCLLAVGNGGSYSMPAWTTGISEDAPVTHVWDGFQPDAVGPQACLGIVGGSITAIQLLTELARPSREITLFSRSPLRVEQLEAETEWMHFSELDRLHGLPPASQERARLIESARNNGAVPPYTARRFRRVAGNQPVTVEESEVSRVTPAGGTVVVTCEDGTTVCLDKLVCATGFGSPYDGPLFRKLRAETSLQTGYRGAPVLDDDTLRWRRQDGTLSRVFVSGVAARQVLGPFARNIVGARRAGSVITEAVQGAEPATTGVADTLDY